MEKNIQQLIYDKILEGKSEYGKEDVLIVNTSINVIFNELDRRLDIKNAGEDLLFPFAGQDFRNKFRRVLLDIKDEKAQKSTTKPKASGHNSR